MIDNSTRPWATWIITILVGIAVAATGYAVNRVDKLQEIVTVSFVTKEQYNRDLLFLGERFGVVVSKLESLESCMTQIRIDAEKRR